MLPEISLAIYLNFSCNLDCRYCYVKKNSKIKPDLDKVKKSLGYFFGKGSPLFFDLLGGEPLLAFTEIQYLVDYIEQNSRNFGFDYKINLITNGTLLDAKIVKYLFAHDIGLILSLDGIKETHDSQRKFSVQQNSVFDALLAKLKQLNKDYNLISRIRISKVITPASFASIAKDLRLFNDLNFASVDLQIQLYRDWSDNDLKGFSQFMKKFSQEYIALFNQPNNKPIIKINNLSALLRPENHQLFNCEKYRLAPDGSIFLCLSCMLDENFLLDNKLNNTLDCASKKLNFITKKYSAIKKFIKDEDFLFCPLDLFIYCQLKNKDFLREYRIYKNLVDIFNTEILAIAKALAHNQQYKEMYQIE
jgi:uncharacterized protein